MNGTPPQTSDNVRSHWDAEAHKHGCHPTATCPDVYIREIEIAALCRQITQGQVVLDIGCGNGYSTHKIKNATHCLIKGVDFSEGMINVALSTYSGIPFAVADITNLENEADESYDIVTTDRCLINLTTDLEVDKAIKEIRRILKPGGRYLMVECWQRAHDSLNLLRGDLGLPPISIRWHNRYLDDDKICISLWETGFRWRYREDFASLYTIVSKVIYAKACAEKGMEPDYASEINRIAASLQSVGDFGVVRLEVWVKP